MFTTIAHSESLDAGAAFTRIAAVPDNHMRTDGDGIVIGEFNRLIGGYACCGATVTEVRYQSPSLRRHNPCYIRPLELAITPAGIPVHGVDPAVSIPLDTNEMLEVEENGDPAAAEQVSVATFLGTGQITPVNGKIITVNFTITLAQVVSSWQFSEITFPDELPVGDYEIVGAEFVISGGVVARFVPKGEIHRPGAPVVAAGNFGANTPFRFGKMGTWMRFNTIRPPGVEVLGSVAAGSATYQCYMDVIPK